TVEPILGGIVVGVLSSLVLFVNSFPDFDADKAGGRKTLVIMLGKKKAASIVWVFPIVAYCVVVLGIVTHVLPTLSLITLLTIPLLMKSGLSLKQNFDDHDKIIPTMGSVVSYSRITGLLLILSFLFLSK
ncbi:MAG: prenyltransferase, partial [Thaumarchaeota archaeon]